MKFSLLLYSLFSVSVLAQQEHWCKCKKGNKKTKKVCNTYMQDITRPHFNGHYCHLHLHSSNDFKMGPKTSGARRPDAGPATYTPTRPYHPLGQRLPPTRPLRRPAPRRRRRGDRRLPPVTPPQAGGGRHRAPLVQSAQRSGLGSRVCRRWSFPQRAARERRRRQTED
ncbi:hypothetical protein LX32DRAFT_726832 [Colletotrichum zoysiae]|uniref:Uncharacterized protein n=1 Tax=Colletotrichum zoysiae TaxID=1216348 RepID=A0AAD9HMY2_9PEZI|nr:hypothetical protein LX32DRAFT_726832 [Colletotrichum zoysiae]